MYFDYNVTWNKVKVIASLIYSLIMILHAKCMSLQNWTLQTKQNLQTQIRKR